MGRISYGWGKRDNVNPDEGAEGNGSDDANDKCKGYQGAMPSDLTTNVWMPGDPQPNEDAEKDPCRQARKR